LGGWPRARCPASGSCGTHTHRLLPRPSEVE
jgi:hypothetical protein